MGIHVADRTLDLESNSRSTHLLDLEPFLHPVYSNFQVPVTSAENTFPKTQGAQRKYDPELP